MNRANGRCSGTTDQWRVRNSPAIWPPMAAPILSYENLGLIQGEGWLFRQLDLYIGERDKLALIGRNGAGKTTLLKCLADLIETDEGRRTVQTRGEGGLLSH